MSKPNHIAFIMDGNGRWGKKKNKSRNYGHLKGVETVKKVVSAAIKVSPFSNEEIVIILYSLALIKHIDLVNLASIPIISLLLIIE